MEIMDIMAIVQEFAIIPVAAACYLVGWMLKNIWAGFPDEFIPLAILIIGMVGVLWVNGWTFTPQNLMAGLCSAALAVYVHQNGKQLLSIKAGAKAGPTDTETEGD